MSYANPNRQVYLFPLFDYGGASGARVDKIRGPKGKKGRLIDYGVQSIQENFAGTTPATIAVGNASDPDAYGDELSLGTTAATAGGLTVRSQYDPASNKTSFDALMLNPELPADTAIYVTSTEAVTGPTGQACPWVVIDWLD